MLLLIAVNFYTTRVVLEALGIDDFGLYNVVAGFVALVAFINQSLTNSIQRFINFELGKNNNNGAHQFIQSSIFAQWILIIFLLVIAESIGVWFVNAYLNIPEGQKFAANIVYQTSVFTVLFGIFRSAYNAIIIAKERMQFYAIVSLIEGFLQLGIAYILLISLSNRLIIYGFALLGVSIIITCVYIIYAHRLMPQIGIKAMYNAEHLKQIASFCGWNIFGAASGVVKSQGINILMNIFFGVVVNAARGIASQVLNCVFKLASNFQVAMYPQIIQSYASNNRSRYLSLSYSCSKISIYFMWLITLPILITTPEVLKIWLGNNIPEYTVIFVRIILFSGIIDGLGSAISTPIYATGKIKKYQISVSLIILMIIPISYIAFKLGYPPQSSMYISLVLSIIAQAQRVRIWCQLVDENPFNYIKQITLPSVYIIVISTLLSISVSQIFTPSFISIVIISLLTLFINVILIYLIGLNSQEKTYVMDSIKKFQYKFKS